jgi:hypothetical protein
MLRRNAKVAELADAPDLGSGPARGGGSSPPFRTRCHNRLFAAQLRYSLGMTACPPGLDLVVVFVSHLMAYLDENYSGEFYVVSGSQ